MIKVSAGGRHRFTHGRIADVLTPIPDNWADGGGPAPVRGRLGRPESGGIDRDGSAWTGRALRTLAGIFVVVWSFRLSGYLTFGPWLAVAVVVLGLTGLLAIISAWLPDQAVGARRQRQADWVVLIAVLVALALWSYFQVFMAPDYGTDEIAFDQYAAQLAVHGLDPYLHSMAAAFPLFHVSPNGYTFKLSGQPVTNLSYPALSFEAYMPLLALGIATQAAVWMDVGAWALGAVIMFAVLPRRLAPLAAVVASLDVYIGYAVGGVTDFLFVPLLVGAAVGWDRFPAARGWAAWRGPVLLGLAMAVKQTPWLVAPFLVIGIAAESRREHDLWRAARDGLRYLGIALAAFLAPNLPYLAAAPGAWLHGVITPLSSQAVPAGQGLISLSLSLAVGGGSLQAYTIAALVVLAVALACYAAMYPMLKPAAFLLPSLVLFFATRSFGSYLVMLFPAALVAAATTRRLPVTACWRRWRWVAAGGAVACGVVVAAALTATSPMTISIQSVRTTGQLATVEQLGLTVTNTTGARVRPAFTIEDGMTTTAFWRQTAGPPVLGPHQRAHYTIEAPSYFAMPSISNGFQVVAFSQNPPSVSRTGAYVASLWRVVLQPATINGPVPRGQDITVQAEIVNRLDEPMRVASVPVYLGQVIYAQRGLQYSQALINQGLPGETPVRALTNSGGVATFTIHSPVGGSNPVYFEANLVNAGSAYPYGYSPILAVRFRP
ncbi:MAG TPA: hypothetical protein VMV07_01500 [Streptosporangiaceae bacterium]|nr:hypothetical protein [Streptosporangiaceae bacterium]